MRSDTMQAACVRSTLAGEGDARYVVEVTNIIYIYTMECEVKRQQEAGSMCQR